jgi:hypothetical protein
MSDSVLRESVREATWLQCLVRVNQDTIARGLMTNVSGSGAELRCKYQLEIGQTIEVAAHHSGPRKSASIIRADGNRFGIQWRMATDTVSVVGEPIGWTPII